MEEELDKTLAKDWSMLDPNVALRIGILNLEAAYLIKGTTLN